MKIRKVVAMVLATAVVFTSSGFTQIAYAAENENQETALSDEISEDAQVDKDSEQSLFEDDDSDSKVEKADEVIDGNNEFSEEDMGTESVDEDVAIGNEESEMVDEDNLEGTSADTLEEVEEEASKEELLSDEEIIDEEELVEEEIEYDVDGTVIHAADDYFDRAETENTGILTLKQGAVLAGTIRIPYCTKTIPAGIFKSDSMVRKILIEEKYGGDLQAPELTAIEDEAFAYSNIEEIELPCNVEIGEGAFRHSNLKRINFITTDDSHKSTKSQITEIRDNTFQSTKLETADFPECTMVGDHAFSDCTSLTVVKMPKLEIIKEAAFSGCTYLGDGFSFKEMLNIHEIGNNAFEKCGFSRIDLSNNKRLYSRVKRESGVPTGEYDESNSGLGLKSFADNKNLAYIMFSAGNEDNIDYIPAGVCKGCANLSSITIPAKTVVIGDSAFEGCTALKTVDLQKVQYVKSKAFYNCYNLKDITMRYGEKEEENEEMQLYKEAFPTNSGVTVRGYHEKVEAFANNTTGYTFASLNEKHNIKVYTSGGAKVTLSATSAIVNQKITATVTTTNPLSELYYSSQSTGKVDLDFDSLEMKGSSYSITYSFKMPNANIDFYAKSMTAKELDALNLNLDFESESVAPGTFVPIEEGNVYKWAKRGEKAKIKIMGTDLHLPNWLFTFASDKSNVVSVDANGVISGVSQGKATITATAKWNSKKSCKFTIEVADDVKILKLENGKTNGDIEELKDYISDWSTPCELSFDPITEYPVITFNKTDISKKAATVKLSFDAYAANDPLDYSQGYDATKNYNVVSKWSSSDSNVAKVKSASSNYNENTITVAKGASGETKISMCTLNKGETKVNQYNEEQNVNYEDNLTYVIIKVVDTTPRLGEKDITVNYQLVNGTSVTVVPVYGMESNDDEGLTVVEKRTVNGQVEYYESNTTKQFKVVYDEFDGLYYIMATDAVNLAKGKKLSYKNKLYLQGRYKKGIEGMFYIPIPNITITNEPLSPKLSQNGSINIFYNANAADDEKGKVIVTQSLKNYLVDKYELVSVTNYKKEKSEVSDKEHGSVDVMTKGGVEIPFDSFKYNFDVDFNKDGGGNLINNQAIITMSDDTASDAGYCKVSNKAVVSGYLAIYFHGYREPSYVALTVKTVNTAPKYLLSQTKATVVKEYIDINRDFDLYLYPNGKANVPENAVTLGTKVYEAPDKYYANFDAKNTKANFMEGALQNSNKLNDDRLCLRIPAGISPIAGKARISLHMNTWADKTKYLYYDFTLSTTDKIKTTFKDNISTVVVNKAFYNTDDESDAGAATYKQIIDFNSSIPSDVEIAYISDAGDKRNLKNPANCAAYDAVRELLEYGEKCVYVRQPNEDEIEELTTGKYTFIVDTNLKYKGSASSFESNSLSFVVNITKTAPTVSMGKITLNSSDKAVDEVVQVSCKYTNLPKNLVQNDFSVDVANASYKHSSKAVSDGTDGKFKNPKDDDEFKEGVAIITYPGEDEEIAYAIATKGENKEKYSSSVGKYVVSGAILCSEGNNLSANLSNYNVEVAANKNNPTITLKQLSTDKMNLIIPESGFNYSTTLNNIVGNIRPEVGIMEYDGKSGKYVESRFAAEYDSEKGITRITVRDDWDGTGDISDPNQKWNIDQIKANNSYSVYLFYGVDSMSHFVSPEVPGYYKGYDIMVGLKVTPTEVFPKLTVTTVKPYAYAGQDRREGYFGAKVDPGRTDNQWDVKVEVKLENSFWLKKDNNKNGIYDAWDGDLLTGANVTAVDWVDSVSKAIKDEFAILDSNPVTYNPYTGIISFGIRLNNGSEQVQNKTYKLVMTPSFEERQKKDYITKSTNKFTVDLEVRK